MQFQTAIPPTGEIMKIERYYCLPCDDNLRKKLISYNIKVDYDDKITRLMTFSVYEEDDYFDKIADYLPKNYLGSYVFTKTELLSAEWLTMRSTNDKLEALNIERTFSFSCESKEDFGYGEVDTARHRIQVAPYEFRGPIKWGRNHFYSSYFGGFETIFCDDIAKSIIQSANLDGIDFLPVIHYKKNNYLDNIHQIECSNVLPNESLVLNQYFKEKKCPICGAIKYEYDELSRLGIHKEFLGNKDFYRTNYIFGGGYTSPFNVVSNRIYKLLVDNQIDRNIRFTPLLIY